MKINFWNLQDMNVAERERIMNRAEADIGRAIEVVRPIIADVKARGDAALIDYAAKFDGARITGGLKARDEDFARAYKRLDSAVAEAIRALAANVRRHHEQQMERVEPFWLGETAPGVYAGEKITAIDSVGLYVPRGKGAFPSVMYMLCLPAKIARVEKIIVCTPPSPDGGFDDASLVAADICGVRDVYMAGGAQAIAALAYGTESIPPVVQVNGPGNAYVAAAKRILGRIVNPGLPSGPSEAIILADGSADSWNTTLDLINEAEHGSDSASLLVTDSAELAKDVAAHLPDVIAMLPQQRRKFCEDVFSGYGGIIVCQNMADAIDFCNDYAVEHLLLKTRNANDVVARLRNCGEILIGESTPIALANFGAGVNAVLPTGRMARSYDCTSVWSFLKRTSVSYATRDGLNGLRATAEILARYEGFDGHALALRERRDAQPSDFQIPAHA
ncbi:MAG TPA: histidinol dehydrogenase [Rhizomicrobium sp.]|jgi:histidinol dehydrogenase